MPRLAHDERRLGRLRPAGDEDVQPDDDASVDQPVDIYVRRGDLEFRDLVPDAGVAATPLAETSRQRWQHALPPDDRARTTTADVGVTVALLSDKDGSVARAFGSPKAFSRSIRPVKRTTFVIGTDRLILDVINSETHMHIHADRALSHA
jgi:hypothetical protein